MPFMVNYLVHLNITGTPVTLAALSLCSNSVFAHTCSPFFEEAPLKVIQYGQNQATNKLVASVKYIWVLANPLAVE